MQGARAAPLGQLRASGGNVAAPGLIPILLFKYYLFRSCYRNILLVCSLISALKVA
jgi:hypothetical protein